METLIIFIFVVFPLLMFVFRYRQYKDSSYSQVTKNSYFSVFRNAGMSGEYLTYNKLKGMEAGGAKFLFNLYLPASNNRLSEIDVLLITTKGLFVIESKNYSGWIFGHEAQRYWTQVLPAGRGRSHKERFYNPIHQNHSHIKTLKKIVGESLPIHSVIAFSDHCTLKDVTVVKPTCMWLSDPTYRVASIMLMARWSRTVLRLKESMDYITGFIPSHRPVMR